MKRNTDVKHFRSSAPIERKIDEWNFRFNVIDYKVVVSIHRTPDPQKNNENDPDVKLIASYEGDIKQGVPWFKLEHTDIATLRDNVQHVFENALKIEWEKIIVVGVEKTVGADREAEGLSKIKFAFAVGERSKCGQFYRLDEESHHTRNFHYFGHQGSRGETPGSLLGWGWHLDDDDTTYHVIPYSAEVESTLAMIATKVDVLADQLAKLTAPDQIHKLSIVKLLENAAKGK